jgi:hypothetical protein
MNERHEPAEEFVSRLEWRLLSEVRRGDRFEGAIEPRKTIKRRLRVLPLGLLCFGLGIAATTATQYFRESARAEYLIAKAESDLHVARTNVEATRAVLEWFAGGAARGHPFYGDESFREREVEIARERLEDAKSDLELARLALDEVRLTHQPPATELWAPPVDGRDFVSERLLVELGKGKRRLFRLRERGAPVYIEDYSGEAPIHSIEEAKVARLERSLDLRGRFLDGRISRSELVDLERLAEAKDRLKRISEVLPVFRESYDGARAQFEAGHASPLAVVAAEVDLRRMEALLRLTRTEIELLEAGLDPAAGE